MFRPYRQSVALVRSWLRLRLVSRSSTRNHLPGTPSLLLATRAIHRPVPHKSWLPRRLRLWLLLPPVLKRRRVTPRIPPTARGTRSSTRCASLPVYFTEVKDPCSVAFVANILVLEPWYRGSHRKWLDGWRSTSKHQINIIEGPDTGWRRSLLISPARFAEAIAESPAPIDALVASTPIDLATVMGLLDPGISRPPTLLYMKAKLAIPPDLKGDGLTEELSMIGGQSSPLTGSLLQRASMKAC